MFDESFTMQGIWRRLLFQMAACFISVITLGYFVRDSMHVPKVAGGLVLVLIGGTLATAFSTAGRIRRSGIDPALFQSYIATRPLMIIAQLGIFVSVLFKAAALFAGK